MKKKLTIGGIIRDHNGDMIMDLSMAIQCDSNNQAEAATVSYGLKWCSENGYTKIQLELKSLIITNILKNEDTRNLKLKPTILSSIQALRDMDVEISHCYREANGPNFLQDHGLEKNQTSLSLKLNVDDFSEGNTCRARGGGVLRDHRGHMVMAFSKLYGQGSNNLTEAKVILIGARETRIITLKLSLSLTH
ncbi:hypothetical protein HAX54_015808 [Datura stramonium]|uniref:RNase H type-1 domain-containing protein n=1 Tax=Datura stramonium TaxID=4076 RepID=A0ABS8UHY1_DATST|nr:hypothetical protein [Datura stramonium]